MVPTGYRHPGLAIQLLLHPQGSPQTPYHSQVPNEQGDIELKGFSPQTNQGALLFHQLCAREIGYCLSFNHFRGIKWGG